MSPVNALPSAEAGPPTLTTLGWDEHFGALFEALGHGNWEPGRVVAEHRGAFAVATAGGELSAEVSGRLRYDALTRAELPVVGDWVALAGPSIQAVLGRRTVFARLDPDPRVGEQLLASNVDVAFLVTSLNHDFNLRRLERYLTMAWSSGAQPVVILSKADLVADVDGRIEQVRTVAIGLPVIAVSVPLALGLEEVRSFVAPGRTAIFLGSSGVGKSTLINALAGASLQAVGEVRADDDHGRHTTTRRQLVVLPGGWLVIDTPGLRELALAAADAEEAFDHAFADIDALAATCRFADCGHRSEPGCAVKAAIGDGRLDAGRLDSHRKLERELNRTVRAIDPAARAAHRSKWRAIHRSVNEHMQRKYGADR